MYYIISSEYLGPNKPGWHIVTVETEPGKTNMSHEERTKGYLGTSNDVRQYAHGAYETEDEACAAALALAEIGAPGSQKIGSSEYDSTVIAVYRVGYERWNADGSQAWVYPGMHEDINADTTDKQIQELVDNYEKILNEEHGGTLDYYAVYDMMSDYRDKLREGAKA